MVAPAHLANDYALLNARLRDVSDFLMTRVRSELTDLHPVTVEPRVKGLGSVYQKLQTGKYGSVLDMPDLVGVKVVLLRRSEVETAVDVIQRSQLRIVDTNLDRPIDPSSLSYFEPHLVVRLPAEYCERNPQVEAVQAEIQFTTALQHALDMVTHDFDYKGRSFKWGNFRLVSQLRGTLQLVDNLLDDIEVSATLERSSVAVPDEFERGQQAIDWLISRFTDEGTLPTDLRRSAQVLLGFLDAAGMDVSDLAAISGDDAHSDLLTAASLDPLDAALGVILRTQGIDWLRTYDRYICLPDELRSLCAEARSAAELTGVNVVDDRLALD